MSFNTEAKGSYQSCSDIFSLKISGFLKDLKEHKHDTQNKMCQSYKSQEMCKNYVKTCNRKICIFLLHSNQIYFLIINGFDYRSRQTKDNKNYIHSFPAQPP